MIESEKQAVGFGEGHMVRYKNAVCTGSLLVFIFAGHAHAKTQRKPTSSGPDSLVQSAAPPAQQDSPNPDAFGDQIMPQNDIVVTGIRE